MTRERVQTEKREATRERLFRLLVREPQTVERIARELGLTKNAVRSQLSLMQREGSVEVRGAIKGSRRPAAVYGARTGAEPSPSKAYPAVLTHLVKVLAERETPREFASVMRDLGRSVAEASPLPAGTPRRRIEGVVEFLRSLGSRAELRREDGKVIIIGDGCPLAKVVREEPRTCKAMESLLSRLTGLPVHERCDHREFPSCRFEIKLPEDGETTRVRRPPVRG